MPHTTGYDLIDMRFGEIGVKGRNRDYFVAKLRNNVSKILEGESYAALEQKYDRVIVRLDGKSDLERMMGKIGHVPGIVWFAPAKLTGNSLKEISETALGLLAGGGNGPVRVVAHRAFKGVDFDSFKIVSDIIKKGAKGGIEFDKDSQRKVFINVTKDGAFVYDSKRKGIGGLPVGSSGRAVVLLSGGIDSPLAAYYGMKRGLEPIYLHVHAYGTNKEAAESKMADIAEALRGYYGSTRIYYAPGHVFQSYAAGTGRYELVAFKRFLYKLAKKIAGKEDAGAIITGESLGQVASQTLGNLSATGRGINTLFFRPLIGFDKQEIIDGAKEIGTYEISIKKYRDICSINAKDPPTAATYANLSREYKKARLDRAVAETLKRCEPYIEDNKREGFIKV